MEKFINTLKKTLIDENKTLADLAKELDTQPQNLSNKLRRGSITYDYAQEIADKLGYDVKWYKR